MLLLFVSVILVGAVTTFLLHKRGVVQGRNTIILGGLVSSLLWILVWVILSRVGESDMFPRRRIVTDGNVFEVETQYYPLSSWHRSYREFSSVEAIREHLSEMQYREQMREEHESRPWKEIK